jgi:hypothetical protein
VTKNTLSASFTYAEVKPSIAYRISTVSLSGQETGMEEFDIRYPQIKSPTGLMVSIAVDNVRGTAVTTYSLDWQANSQNHPTFVKGYKLYKKEGSGNFVLLESLSKTASSYTYTSDSQSKIQFALSTTSVMNTESAMVVFGSQ